MSPPIRTVRPIKLTPLARGDGPGAIMMGTYVQLLADVVPDILIIGSN
jgi:hypothetical protein